MIYERLCKRIGALRLVRFILTLSATAIFCACGKSHLDNISNLGIVTNGASSITAIDRSTGFDIAHYSKLYIADPKNKTNALNYASALRKAGHKNHAVSVLRTASAYHGMDIEFLSAYGRTTLANDQAAAAIKILAKADDPNRPDWRTVSARGTAFAKLGRYKDASYQFERALKLAPKNPSVMNNLAMAKAANGDLKIAETLLSKASQMPIIDPKVKRNLAIVLRLQGRKSDAQNLETEAFLSTKTVE
ncbi:MAG: hypothetical protein TECD_00189 [Hyphomicrobiaceae bacterium hypho_1]